VIVLYAVKPTERAAPLATSSGRIARSGVCGPISPHRNIVEAPMRVAATITERKPKRRRSGVVVGLITKLPTNSASTTAPDLTALQWKPTWKSRGSRNGTAWIAKR
jgi:hypothetical protein